ncbi:cupin domain-containing protein [Pararhodobacter zhoushanensis]|uniref:Cupin domain-containing protein n=1 Tax=Pararhodobacter zhoushanensis TaxID=2479545 RepID=A0ABT3H4F8_9RHOB|nr:cupin domain-containing protein [Pararhodobacter zhoushanensis]MCW1934686.1 cupin domain-containing protein [Pararhodobacter zhoushanensis]
MPKIDLSTLTLRTGSIYPEPYAGQMAGRSSHRLGQAAGLTQFGVNIVYLEPGGVASLRHWHLNEDEFAMVLTGELILSEDTGETVMHPGDCAAWKAGEPVGHRFVNRTDAQASFLVVGSKAPREVATYTEVDFKLIIEGNQPRYTYHDGSDWAGHRDLAPQGGTDE